MFIISIFGKVAVVFRTWIRFFLLTILSLFLIVSLVVIFYKPTYAVSLNGQVIGYTENKSELQSKISEYISANEEKNIAFVQVDAMPTYKLCLLKKDVTKNDDEIFKKV